MKLSTAIQKAYKRKWSYINSFTVQIILPIHLISKIGNFDDELNLNIISLTTPDFTNEPIEVFVANKWIIQNGKDTLYRFSMTFRDENQLKLYKKFMIIYTETKENYFDDIAFNVIIYKDADYIDEQDKLFMNLEGVLVEGVSNLSFSNDTENQIAEFTVSFKCNNPSIQ